MPGESSKPIAMLSAKYLNHMIKHSQSKTPT